MEQDRQENEDEGSTGQSGLELKEHEESNLLLPLGG